MVYFGNELSDGNEAISTEISKHLMTISVETYSARVM
jgi:hypothetical protein